MELWQKFSVNARKTILIAHDGCDGRLISSARISLGLIGLGEGKAYKRLAALPDLPGLVISLEELAAQAPSAEADNISFTPDAQRVISRAYHIAKEEDADQLETRHLLAGLLQESEVGSVLREAGLTEE
jgi:ATP-dependent Clp protease ATP-binding subunit ClpA